MEALLVIGLFIAGILIGVAICGAWFFWAFKDMFG